MRPAALPSAQQGLLCDCASGAAPHYWTVLIQLCYAMQGSHLVVLGTQRGTAAVLALPAAPLSKSNSSKLPASPPAHQTASETAPAAPQDSRQQPAADRQPPDLGTLPAVVCSWAAHPGEPVLCVQLLCLQGSGLACTAARGGGIRLWRLTGDSGMLLMHATAAGLHLWQLTKLHCLLYGSDKRTCQAAQQA